MKSVKDCKHTKVVAVGEGESLTLYCDGCGIEKPTIAIMPKKRKVQCAWCGQYSMKREGAGNRGFKAITGRERLFTDTFRIELNEADF